VKKRGKAKTGTRSPSGYHQKRRESLDLVQEAINAGYIDREKLPEILASSWAEQEMLSEENEKLCALVTDYQRALSVFAAENPEFPYEARFRLLKMLEEVGSEAATVIGRALKLQRSATARRIANARHNRPGGARDKQQQIRDIWATGKYTSRDRCAEEECAALNMSFSAARKALRNTPDPARST